MTKIYIAAPLFSESERQFNLMVNETLIKNGFETFLPQKDGLELDDMVKMGMGKEESEKKIFNLDISELRKADIVVFVMDGRVPDEGACVEIGYAFGIGKECIGIKTDVRSLIRGSDNPMITGALKHRIAHNIDDLLSILKELNGSNSC